MRLAKEFILHLAAPDREVRRFKVLGSFPGLLRRPTLSPRCLEEKTLLMSSPNTEVPLEKESEGEIDKFFKILCRPQIRRDDPLNLSI